uniref:Uncharacterized protein n=1 Tax=Tetranychus urticae TaxID=32264 RepID=T1K806_TETUR
MQLIERVTLKLDIFSQQRNNSNINAINSFRSKFS